MSITDIKKTKSSIEYFEKAIKRNQTEYRLLNKEYNKFQDTLAGLDIDNISGTFVDACAGAGAGAGAYADTGNDNDNNSIGLGAGADNDNSSHSDSHNDNDNDSISNKEEKEEKYTLDFAKDELKKAGDLAKKYGHRITFHPGQFCVVGAKGSKLQINSESASNCYTCNNCFHNFNSCVWRRNNLYY
jgi:hypothetical protein